MMIICQGDDCEWYKIVKKFLTVLSEIELKWLKINLKF